MTTSSIRITIPATHPSLPGHFPGAPIVPGVVLLDVLVAALQGSLATPTHLTAMPVAKFLRPVLPDEMIEIHFSLNMQETPRIWRIVFEAICGTDPVFEGTAILAADSPNEARQASDRG